MFIHMYRHHMSALLYAAKTGRSKVVLKLLELGANVHKQDSKGFTVCILLFTLELSIRDDVFVVHEELHPRYFWNQSDK